MSLSSSPQPYHATLTFYLAPLPPPLSPVDLSSSIRYLSFPIPRRPPANRLVLLYAPLLAPPAAQEGATALIVSSVNGHTETVALLVEKGADVEAKAMVRRKSAGAGEGEITNTGRKVEGGRGCLYM